MFWAQSELSCVGCPYLYAEKLRRIVRSHLDFEIEYNFQTYTKTKQTNEQLNEHTDRAVWAWSRGDTKVTTN